jgi:hypothetical protein
MHDPALRTELMRSLGRLTQGLSALFWGLPITLLLAVQAATTNWLGALGPFGSVAPVVGYGLLVYGLVQLRSFQRQERVWLATQEQARLFALTNLGLSPFLHWYQRLPEVSLFANAVLLLGLFSLAFLFALNRLLERLAAMLPDETLRLETAAFTRLNRWLLALIPLAALGLYLLWRWNGLPASTRLLLNSMEPLRFFVLLFLLLLPLAVTMSLVWKIKEAILVSVFGEDP